MFSSEDSFIWPDLKFASGEAKTTLTQVSTSVYLHFFPFYCFYFGFILNSLVKKNNRSDRLRIHHFEHERLKSNCELADSRRSANCLFVPNQLWISLNQSICCQKWSVSHFILTRAVNIKFVFSNVLLLQHMTESIDSNVFWCISTCVVSAHIWKMMPRKPK